MTTTAPAGFAAFILTHGRADRVVTYATLRKHGYTGPIYLVVDDEDSEGGAYRDRYGDQVITFSKRDMEGTFDTGDLSPDRRGVIYARNATDQIARELGVTAYIQLDDDYNNFGHRYIDGAALRSVGTHRLDDVFALYLQFLDDTGAVTVAFAQGGDYLGGTSRSGYIHRGLLRKVMNSFIVRTGHPIGFVGRVNEDTTTYVVKGNRGQLFFTPMAFDLNQATTQTNPGGMTEIYLDSGTYVKSFYTVMMQPSSVRVALMKSTHMRMHHQINWRHTVPVILNEKHQKTRKAAGE